MDEIVPNYVPDPHIQAEAIFPASVSPIKAAKAAANCEWKQRREPAEEKVVKTEVLICLKAEMWYNSFNLKALPPNQQFRIR